MGEYKVIPTYDLNKALADVLFTAKVVLGECDDGQ